MSWGVLRIALGGINVSDNDNQMRDQSYFNVIEVSILIHSHIVIFSPPYSAVQIDT